MLSHWIDNNGAYLHNGSTHVGTRFRKEVVRRTVEIQADGHELELILNICDGIPVAKNARIMNWYGDHAKFILSTWNTYHIFNKED